MAFEARLVPFGLLRQFACLLTTARDTTAAAMVDLGRSFGWCHENSYGGCCGFVAVCRASKTHACLRPCRVWQRPGVIACK